MQGVQVVGDKRNKRTNQPKDWLCEGASSFYMTLHAETNVFVVGEAKESVK